MSDFLLWWHGLGSGLTMWWFHAQGWTRARSLADERPPFLPVLALLWPAYWLCRGLKYAALWCAAAWAYARRPQ